MFENRHDETEYNLTDCRVLVHPAVSMMLVALSLSVRGPLLLMEFSGQLFVSS